MKILVKTQNGQIMICGSARWMKRNKLVPITRHSAEDGAMYTPVEFA